MPKQLGTRVVFSRACAKTAGEVTMSAKIIDGTVIAEELRGEIAADAAKFTARYGYPPGLGVVLVGDDPASAQYVRMKRRACEKAGITSVARLLRADSTQEEAETA